MKVLPPPLLLLLLIWFRACTSRRLGAREGAQANELLVEVN